MKFDKSLFLKWIDFNHTGLGDFDYDLVDRCTLIAYDKYNQCKGFTVFEMRTFDERFIERFKERSHKPEFKDAVFKLYMPYFQQFRAEKLLASVDLNISIIWTSFVNLKKNNNELKVRDRLRVVNVDDSPVILKLLKHIINEFDSVEILEQINDSKEAAQRIKSLSPDVVTMDIQMPEKTGVDVVRELLNLMDVPVIMVSSLSPEDGPLVFDALNSGAFDYIQKPKQEEQEQFSKDLKEKLLAAVAGSGKHSNIRKVLENSKQSKTKLSAPIYPSNLVWALGSSTGGTQALTRVFTTMPSQIPPTLIVQHIPPIFSKSFAESLNNLCPFTVKEAEDGELVQPNHVYIAAGGKQMQIRGSAGHLRVYITDDPPVNRFKPSVDYMFESIAKIPHLKLVAGILTGMGSDGAQGLLKLKNIGAFTFAQDEQSSAVYGMPRVAAEIGAADKVVGLDQMASVMLNNSQDTRKKAG